MLNEIPYLAKWSQLQLMSVGGKSALCFPSSSQLLANDIQVHNWLNAKVPPDASQFSLFHLLILSVFSGPDASVSIPVRQNHCCYRALSFLMMIWKFSSVTLWLVSNATPRNNHQMVMKSRLVVCLLWIKHNNTMANFAFASRAYKYSSKCQFAQLFTDPWATSKVCLAALFA